MGGGVGDPSTMLGMTGEISPCATLSRDDTYFVISSGVEKSGLDDMGNRYKLIKR